MTRSDPETWHLATTESEFLDLQSDWERLFAKNPKHSPFLAWGWVDAWLRHIAGPHELLIASLRDSSGELVFVLPLLKPDGSGLFGAAQVTLVCSYGPECSENLGCLYDVNFASRSAELTLSAITEFVGSHETISLRCLEDYESYPSSLEVEVRRSGRTVRVRHDVFCPTTHLPGSWDEYLLQLSSNFRSQVRRSFKQIGGEGQPRFRQLAASDADVFTSELVRLNRSRIQEKGDVSSLEDGAFRRFLHEAIPYMASQGIAWMDVIEKSDETLGSALNFVHGESICYYMGGFDSKAGKLRPGTALFALAMQRGIDSGFTMFNFLRGDEHYKYRWGAEDAPTRQVTIYPAGFLRGKLMLAMDTLFIVARRLLSSLRNILKRRS